MQQERGLTRLDMLSLQLTESALAANKTQGHGEWETKDLMYSEGKTKLDWFKIHGWGFKDTEFVLDGRTEMVGLTGNKYLFAGKMMPNFKEWAIEMAGIDLSKRALPKKLMTPKTPILNDDFLTALGENYSRISFDDKERINLGFEKWRI